jgi:hypothetical protein
LHISKSPQATLKIHDDKSCYRIESPYFKFNHGIKLEVSGNQMGATETSKNADAHFADRDSESKATSEIILHHKMISQDFLNLADVEN